MPFCCFSVQGSEHCCKTLKVHSSPCLTFTLREKWPAFVPEAGIALAVENGSLRKQPAWPR